MNQRGSNVRMYLARLAGVPENERIVNLPEATASPLERGARVLFYELRGEGEQAKGYITGWGDIERLSTSDGTTAVQLREYVSFKRRVPFSELRADPRRDPAAEVQPVSAEVFNAVLAEARRR